MVINMTRYYSHIHPQVDFPVRMNPINRRFSKDRIIIIHSQITIINGSETEDNSCSRTWSPIYKFLRQGYIPKDSVRWLHLKSADYLRTPHFHPYGIESIRQSQIDHYPKEGNSIAKSSTLLYRGS